MSTLEVVLIIALVIGVIFSNLAVLKYSAKFKMPQFGDPNKKPADQQQDADKANEASDPEPREAQSEAGEKDESKK
ncbi:DUF2897 family protein [Shewanella khirikhana]|uniref:DUF2897 family protein n=1 Tax=Shewanella khirikhana TaxID=1965282 RepID=UPI0030CA65A4